MRLDPGPSDWLKLAVLVVGVPLLARSTFVALGRHPAWRSPWKRMLVIAPLLLFAVFAVVMFFIVVND